jgi:DNA modification methylase
VTARILTGDCRDILPTLDAGSVHCCVTSPPYFGLRSYLDNGHIDKPKELGLESSLDAYIAELLTVFRLVKRVLRDDGTCWLNLGDSYASSSPCDRRNIVGNGSPTADMKRRSRLEGGLKEKDLMMVPARVALALQADGWWLRSDIIWHKPNPMPESVTDRPTSSHEHVFLLTKKPRYFYDAEAVKQDSIKGDAGAGLRNWRPNQNGNERISAGQTEDDRLAGRNLRNVWTIATQPYSEAHFATFPTTLVEPCIKAGTSERGCCAACGAPWTRLTERTSNWQERKALGATAGNVGASATYQNGVHGERVDHDLQGTVTTIGWQSSCQCQAGNPIPCTVLDIFGGAGTVGLVADRLNRNSILIELNEQYAKMARQRLIGDAPLFASVETS